VKERWLYCWALGSVAFGGASLLVPLYLVDLGASPVDLGLLAASAAIIGAPGAIVFGRLANRVAHRRTLVVATLATVAVTLGLLPMLDDIGAVVVANAALWLVVGAVAPVLTMLVVDDAPEALWGERIGRMSTFQGYGWAGGLVLGTVWPVVGGLVLPAPTVTRSLFWVLAVCAAVGTVGAARTLPRPAPTAHVAGDRQVRRVARLLARSRRGVRGVTFAFSPNRLYWATSGLHFRRLRGRLDGPLATYFVAAVLFFTGFAAFWAPLPLFLTDAAFGSAEVFALYLVSSLASAVLYEGAGRLATRYDVRTLQTGALVARGVLFPVVALVASVGSALVGLGTVAVVLAAVGLTWAVITVVGTAIVTRLAAPGVRSEVLGVYTALGAVAGGVGGVLGGWLATFGYLVAFSVSGALVVLGAGLAWTLGAIRPAAASSVATRADRPSPRRSGATAVDDER